MQYRARPEKQPERSSAEIHPGYFGYGIRYRLVGSLCYRLADQAERSRIACERGITIVEDVRDYDPYPLGSEDTEPPAGLLYEMPGDFRLYARTDGYEELHGVAEEHYEGARSPSGWQSEREFDALVRPIFDLAKAIDYGLDEDTRSQWERSR